MYLNPTQLPQHLRQDYNSVANAYKKLLDDVKEYQTSLIPMYYSIPRYFSDVLGLNATYDEMLELGQMAKEACQGQYKVGRTALGDLLCFKEDLLDKLFDTMTLEDDEAD